MDKLQKMISEKSVVIFSKNSCCMSHTIKTLFIDFGVNPTIYELDEISRGHEIEQALAQLGCSPAVPVVYIGGQLVGGANQVMSLHLNRSLVPMLKRAVGISLGPLAPWILWALWLARNDRIFNNKGTTPEEVITKATAAAQEWLREQGNEPIIRNNPPPQRPLDTAHYACLQSDAAWRSDLHLAGLGWMVTEGHQASSLMSHCFYVSSPLIAEGLALREALFYCIAKGLRAVKCESDSLQLIRALNEETPISEIYGIIADILNLVVAFDYVSFVWIPRSENKAADALAKQALSNASFVASSMNPRV